MSDEEDDLFADSDDDDDEPPPKKAPAPKKQPPKKNPAAVASDSDDDLFNSDSDDDEEEEKKKKSKAAAKPKKVDTSALSKRERMEALAKKKKKDKPSSSSSSNKSKGDKKKGDKKESGYDSGDSYDSETFERTKEDDDFIDRDGDDDGAAELYADDQHFDDDRPDGEDEEGGKKKKKRKMRDYDDDDRGGRKSRAEAEEVGEDGVPLNPIMAVVHRMKKKAKPKRELVEQEEEAKAFLARMDVAAEEDEQAVAERKPALSKLQLLSEFEDMLTRKDMHGPLLEFNVLSVLKRWIQPLPNGKLGNVTVRSRLLASIAQMNTSGDDGIQSTHLKSSGLGRVVMILYKHPDEVASVKRMAKQLIEQWSRPIFSKSSNMKDLARVGRQGTGLAAIKRRADAEQQAQMRNEMERRQVDGGKHANLQNLIDKGRAGGAEGPSSANRVRVPFSRGFAYSVQPESKASAESPGKGGGPAKDNRGKLAKRMLEKGRAVQKNQRSANISVEGRATKG